MLNEKNKIYERADDVHVRGVLVYTDDEHFAYADEELTTKIDGETLKALFLKGEIVIVDGDAYCRPIMCYPDGEGYAAVTLSVDDGTYVHSAEFVPVSNPS